MSIQFQSTPPCGGRPARCAKSRWATTFQSTPPCGGRQDAFATARAWKRFNPRPRAGGDKTHLLPLALGNVSIHAPVRGATRPGRVGRDGRDVSIHAPVRGATGTIDDRAWSIMFQSTPPCGGRRGYARQTLTYNGFNPRPRAGGDAPRPRCCSRLMRFQSTPPCGGRPPHPPNPNRPGEVSIHAPVRGATWSMFCLRTGSRRFNPRPRAGGDYMARRTGTRPDLFQSTPPCGGRRAGAG
ncbi:hypothetical protein dsat_2918 [Alkalidesulfovibrio alkalitolerans DSM 16529]|uniref:Uncharacterized protein n=1 Tax=Alkalidesulfovibrio alkalitolerans DSM 16529 TaxID=1121439 RepID=S7UJR2_9BACT|nr:hypothetical protein dsat_2918 [Alkalidesulfovibrio alkalitolerans DSM 16529]